MGAIKMPSSTAIAKAYEESIPRVGPRYKEGVGEVTNFKELAIAGQDNYEIEMRKEEVLKRRAEALEEMPAGEWKNEATTTGATRIGPGMRDNKDKRTKNYEIIRSGLDGFVIDDRSTDWEANVDNRLKPVVKRMKEIAGTL